MMMPIALGFLVFHRRFPIYPLRPVDPYVEIVSRFIILGNNDSVKREAWILSAFF